MLHYLTSPSDINALYLIDMQTEVTVAKKRNTACHRVNLVLDLNQQVLKFLVFLVFFKVFSF